MQERKEPQTAPAVDAEDIKDSSPDTNSSLEDDQAWFWDAILASRRGGG